MIGTSVMKKLQNKSIDWFLYDGDLRNERVKFDSKKAMTTVGKAALSCLHCSIFSVSYE